MDNSIYAPLLEDTDEYLPVVTSASGNNNANPFQYLNGLLQEQSFMNSNYNPDPLSSSYVDTDIFIMNNPNVIPLQTQQTTEVPTTQESVVANFFQNNSPGSLNYAFQVEEINFKTEFYKDQKKKSKNKTIIDTKQRVKDGEIKLLLKFQSESDRDHVEWVTVKVKRTNEAKLDIDKRIGGVPLNTDYSRIDCDQIMVKVDLDSVYMYNGKQVYALERNQTELNLYHLIIEVHFNDRNIVTRSTKTFKIIGKDKNAAAKPSAPKRKRADSGVFSYYSTSESPSSMLTPTSPKSESSDKSDRVLVAGKLVADHIKTKTLNVDGMFLGRIVQTNNGDIAYHFEQLDKNQKFQEGEVIGFVPDTKNENKQVICKLDYKLASQSILKGVITRSQYLEARVPPQGVVSETICMLGLVPVQVVGNVHMNEPLYASPYYPGKAVGGHQLDIKTLKEPSFIGYSFSSRKVDDESSVGVVEAVVSILQTASQCLMTEKIRAMEDNVEEKFYEIKKENKSRKRCLISCGVVTFTILLLLSILLWQLFMPGSKLRYAICERGRKKPDGSARFDFIPIGDIFANPVVNGIEFEYDDLLAKFDYTDIARPVNSTNYRYYLNIDRCAYGTLRTTQDKLTGQKKVYGPEMFAVDENCYNAYYHADANRRWQKYISVSWIKKKNLFCYPESKARREERLKAIKKNENGDV